MPVTAPRPRRLVPLLVLALSICLSSAAGPAAPAPAAPPLDSARLKTMKWRPIGPANMGGRVSSIAVEPGSTYTFYVGLGTGGVMKTTDNGTTWQGVFEKESVASVGAIAVSPSDPNVVWVGTGEANSRNSSSWGDGVYRSTDAGGRWTNVGLRDTHNIARIVVDPGDAASAWVCALGHLWGTNRERGVFRTGDAGRSWSASLQVDESVGCIDLAADPSNPRTLYAAMYHRIRRPWSFTSGGEKGGIYKSTDGGLNWRKLTAGLPSQTGRIGLDVSRSDPRVVYAVVESDLGGQSSIDDFQSRSGGVFRSDDGGESWKRMSGLIPRAFYFSQIRVDPKESRRVYVLGYQVHVSEDGGASFRDDGAPLVHIDHHALWIDPANSDHMLLGNDGGIYASYNRGRTWEFFNNMAIGEFYRISADLSRPYLIAGGLQDNFNWIGPSATRSPEGITNGDWRSLGGGDGFSTAIDPNDPDIVYAESQEGYAFRLNLRSGQRKSIRPQAKEGSPGFRFHWNAPLILSRHDSRVLYLAGNRVFRLTERGDRWEAISPDLSTQDHARALTIGSGAENYGLVYTLAESPRRRGLLWAGTDDGKVWVTQNDGGSWTDLTANLPRSVKGLWMSRLEASHHDDSTAYLAVDGHTSDQFAPFVLVTTDLGRTWKPISSDLPPTGPVKVVREDPRNPNLLFAGTEFGLFASFDRGGRWLRLDSGLPTVAVDDILVHPRDFDLVIATHGRSLYVMDDIRPLQELTAEVVAAPARLFSARPALEFHMLPEGTPWNKRVFKGENPPFGAILSYWVREFTGEEASLSIADATGRVVRKLTGPAAPGVNRVIWNLQPDKDPIWDFGTPSGQPRLVAPGTYTVTFSLGSYQQKEELIVEAEEGLLPE